jgi:hypothetical protein
VKVRNNTQNFKKSRGYIGGMRANQAPHEECDKIIARQSSMSRHKFI